MIKQNHIAAIASSAAFLLVLFVGQALAQGRDTAVLNNPYSPRSTGFTIKERDVDISRKLVSIEPARKSQSGSSETPAVASATVDPSTIYRIGANDVLRIKLLNSNGGQWYVKVGNNGCVDFQLTGKVVCFGGKTTVEAAKLLEGTIKLFAIPSVKVEVLEFASHVITILGLVEQPGEQQIQRDAVPFFVVRAGLVLGAAAASVRIGRNGSDIFESYRLNDEALAAVYVYPGDIVEFF